MQVETDEDEMGYVDGQYYARRYKYIIPQIGLVPTPRRQLPSEV